MRGKSTINAELISRKSDEHDETMKIEKDIAKELLPNGITQQNVCSEKRTLHWYH